MYIVVTGAAGFIGSNLVRALNARGETDIIAVDNLRDADKFRNLADCDIADYLDQDEFVARVAAGDFEDDITAVLHQGACSDTMESDGRFMLRNNYRYSVTLLDHCQDNDIPFLYASSASVYGAGTQFTEKRANEAPLNVYGYSKFLFDQYVRRMLPERTAQVAGFRYFNVYGPREPHKGRDGVGRVPFLPPVSGRRTGQALRRLGRLCRRRAAPRFRLRRRRGQRSISTSWTTRRAPASSISAPATRETFNDGGRGDGQRVPRARGQAAARAGRTRAAGRDRVHPVPAAARRTSTRASRRRTSPRCAPPDTRRR